MKPGVYISSAHSPGNEHCLAEWIVFELTEDHLEMIKNVRRALIELKNEYGGWGSISLSSRNSPRVLVLNWLDDDCDELELFPGIKPTDLPAEGALYIGETWDWESPSDDLVWRSECEGFKVYERALYITMLGKYTSDVLETLDINYLLFPDE